MILMPWLKLLTSFFCFYYQDVIATGGVDTNAVLFDRPSGQIVTTLSGHSKKVSFFFYFLFPFSLHTPAPPAFSFKFYCLRHCYLVRLLALNLSQKVIYS